MQGPDLIKDSIFIAPLSFNPHVAHTAHDVVAGLLAVFQGYYFNRVGRVVRTQDQVAVHTLDILDRASPIFTHGVYVDFALSVWGQRIIVAVEQ